MKRQSHWRSVMGVLGLLAICQTGKASGVGAPAPQVGSEPTGASIASDRHVQPQYFQNNAATNRVLSTAGGTVFFLTNNTLLKLEGDEGDVWSRVAEDIKTATIDPMNERTLYVVTLRGALLKSLDLGKQWITLSGGLPAAGVQLVFVDPTASDRVFASTNRGLFRTTDGGFSWQPTALTTAITQFFVNPSAQNYEYALTADGVVVASDDAGATWHNRQEGLPTELTRGSGRTAKRVPVKVTSLFLVAQGSPYLLAGTSGKGLFHSDKQGAGWRQVTGLGPASHFNALYVGEKELAIAGTTVAVSADGASWTPLPVTTTRMAVSEFDGIARHPHLPGWLVVFRESGSKGVATRIGYVGRGQALVGLSYGVLPRSTVQAAWSGSLAGQPALYATVSNWTPTRYESRYDVEEGTYVSTNNGYSWEYLFSSGCGTTATVRGGAPNEVWVSGGNACLSRLSSEGGKLAPSPGAKFRFMNDRITKVAFDPTDKSLLYYAAGVNEHSVYRYRYTGAGVGEAVELKVGAADIVTCEGNSKHLFAGVSQVSTDGGWSWSDKSAALLKYIANTALAYPHSDLTLLSCRGDEVRVAVRPYSGLTHSGGWSILTSPNLGDSWEVVDTVAGQRMTAVFVDPELPQHMFAVVEMLTGGYASKGQNLDVIETRDNGATWERIFSHQLTDDDDRHEAECITVVRQVPGGAKGAILVGGRIGLWRSDDGGHRWTHLGGAQ